MSRRKQFLRVLKNIAVTVLLLSVAFAASLLIQNGFSLQEHTTSVFVFAVFLISMLTDGYIYGLISALLGVLAVNYAFTFPYFSLNFMIPINLLSAIVMIVIAVLTGTLTTQIKHHEAEKAESERERVRANLLRAISHDLRTPLTTIYASASTLLENRPPLSDEQQQAILRGICEDSEWLVRMVENLLSVTRLDSGQIKIVKAPTVLEELIDSVLLKFRKSSPEQAVAIDIPDEILVIPMDATLIQQVLINLLENAVLHAEGMTELSLRVFEQDGQAVFEIADNGCGIPADKLKTVLAGDCSAGPVSGDSQRHNTGIGLSVCETIIRAHGGRLTAENRPQGGARFRFSLATDRRTWSDE